MKSRNILLIVANPAVSTTLGWLVGFWASQLIHPYDALTKAGHRVPIVSPKGGKVELDAYSGPRDASGCLVKTMSLSFIGIGQGGSALAGLNLGGRVLVDCTPFVGPGLTHGLQSRTSGAEEVRRLAPGAKVVKAFTIYGFENFQNSA